MEAGFRTVWSHWGLVSVRGQPELITACIVVCVFTLPAFGCMNESKMCLQNSNVCSSTQDSLRHKSAICGNRTKVGCSFNHCFLF